MTKHLSTQQIQRFQQRVLSPEERLAVSDHLANCDACRRELGAEKSSPSVPVSLESDLHAALNSEADHLSYEELAGYVDGTSTGIEREIVDGHIKACPQCAKELQELGELRATMSTYPEQTFAPVAKLPWRERLITTLRVPRWRLVLQIAGAALIGGLMVFIGLTTIRYTTAAEQWSHEKTSLLAQVMVEQTGRKQAEEAVKSWQDKQQRMVQELASAKQQFAKVQQQSEHAHREAQSNHAQVIAMEQEIARLEERWHQHENVGTVVRHDEQLLVADEQGHFEWMRTPLAALKIARKTQRAPIPIQIARLIGPEGVMRGNENDFRLVAPLGTMVRNDGPTFSWNRVKGALRYRVSVFDPSGRQEDIASGEATKTEWKPVRPLPRGKTLQWQVTAILQDGHEGPSAPQPGVQPPAKFQILDQDGVAALRTLTRQYGASAVDQGLLYWQFGLLDEAEEQFERVDKTNPQYIHARQMLMNLQDKRHPKN